MNKLDSDWSIEAFSYGHYHQTSNSRVIQDPSTFIIPNLMNEWYGCNPVSPQYLSCLTTSRSLTDKLAFDVGLQEDSTGMEEWHARLAIASPFFSWFLVL